MIWTPVWYSINPSDYATKARFMSEMFMAAFEYGSEALLSNITNNLVDGFYVSSQLDAEGIERNITPAP